MTTTGSCATCGAPITVTNRNASKPNNSFRPRFRRHC